MQSLPADAFTIGVEEEYQLVCGRTGELRSRARDVLAADWSKEIREEVHTTMLEVGTHVCANAAELDAELRRLRLQVASAAAAEELRVVASGVHPFSPWRGHSISPGARYQRILERYGRVLRTEHVFGMHIHVALPPGVDRAQLQNRARWFTPHLLALSCSSPLYEGEDTQFASYRNMLWRRLPNTGPPPQVASETEYRRLVDTLIRSGAAADQGSIYWTIRPHPEYPTLEFRIAEACPRVDDAVAIAAFTRALVAALVDDAVPIPSTAMSSSADLAVMSANDWTAARYGLQAVLAHPGRTEEADPIREWILRLLDRVAPFAEALGDAEALAGVEAILERGNGADRIREVFRREQRPEAVVEWLANESLLGTGLDRRLEQRA